MFHFRNSGFTGLNHQWRWYFITCIKSSDEPLLNTRLAFMKCRDRPRVSLGWTGRFWCRINSSWMPSAWGSRTPAQPRAMHLPLLKGYFYASKQSSSVSVRSAHLPRSRSIAYAKRVKKKKMNPRSEADAQVTTNRWGSLRNCDVRSECFIAAHANQSPNNTSFLNSFNRCESQIRQNPLFSFINDSGAHLAPVFWNDADCLALIRFSALRLLVINVLLHSLSS